jgi:hypothetical protein
MVTKPVRSNSATSARLPEFVQAKLVDSMRSGNWIYEIKFICDSVIPNPAGERKHLGALLVGVYDNGKLEFAGRVVQVPAKNS